MICKKNSGSIGLVAGASAPASPAENTIKTGWVFRSTVPAGAEGMGLHNEMEVAL